MASRRMGSIACGERLVAPLRFQVGKYQGLVLAALRRRERVPGCRPALVRWSSQAAGWRGCGTDGESQHRGWAGPGQAFGMLRPRWDLTTCDPRVWGDDERLSLDGTGGARRRRFAGAGGGCRFRAESIGRGRGRRAAGGVGAHRHDDGAPDRRDGVHVDDWDRVGRDVPPATEDRHYLSPNWPVAMTRRSNGSLSGGPLPFRYTASALRSNCCLVLRYSPSGTEAAAHPCIAPPCRLPD